MNSIDNAPNPTQTVVLDGAASAALSANKVIAENAVLDSASLMQVKMPYRDRFVPDTRRGGPEVR